MATPGYCELCRTHNYKHLDGCTVKPPKTLHEKYPRIYKALKRMHSPAKAIEIMLEANRGGTYARWWIRAIRRMT